MTISARGYRNKCTKAYLVVSDVLKDIDEQVEAACMDFFKTGHTLVLNNVCDNIEYLLDQAMWLVETFEDAGLDMTDARRHVTAYADGYNADNKYFFRKHDNGGLWNWSEMRNNTDKEMKDNEKRQERGAKLASEILDELLSEEKSKQADRMSPEQRRCYEAAFKRPTNYARLSSERQWEIDKDLGILDWDGGNMTDYERYRLMEHFSGKRLNLTEKQHEFVTGVGLNGTLRKLMSKEEVKLADELTKRKVLAKGKSEGKGNVMYYVESSVYKML